MWKCHGIFQQVTAASVAGLLIVGSAQGALMEDFQDDTVGTNPSESGATVSVDENEADGRIVNVVGAPTDPFGGTGNQSLQVTDSSDSGNTNVTYELDDPIVTDGSTASIDFYADSDAVAGNKPGFFFELGDGFPDGPNLRFFDSTANGNAATSVETPNDGFVQAKDSGGSNIAFATDEAHTLNLEINFTDQTYTANVDGTSITIPTDGSGPTSVLPFVDDDGSGNPLSQLSTLEVTNLIGPQDQSQVFVDNINVAEVPEPASLALMGIGGLVMLSTRRRKQNA